MVICKVLNMEVILLLPQTLVCWFRVFSRKEKNKMKNIIIQEDQKSSASIINIQLVWTNLVYLTHFDRYLTL